MRLHVIAIGRLRSGPEQELAADYLDRASKLARRAGFSSIRVREVAESRASSATLRRQDEASRVLATLPAGCLLVGLDATGKELSSSGLAEELRRHRDAGVADLVFLVGGPDGFGAAIGATARLLLSFGRMTWPHRLARVMLAEQIYRSVTILINHPYHRA